MKKIIIKLPDPRVKKFRLQKDGWKSRRFLQASSLMNRLDINFKRKKDATTPYKLKEKTAIILKEYVDSYFVNINESLNSDDGKYLLYTASCFLEEYLSKEVMKKHEK